MEAAKRLAITCKPYFKSNFKRDKYKSNQSLRKSRNNYSSSGSSRKYYSPVVRRDNRWEIRQDKHDECSHDFQTMVETLQRKRK